jgi:transglutaminase-like putative cysteine protease
LQSDLDKAIALYDRIRDDISYTPYLDYGDPETYRASNVLRNGYGFCISKAALLSACCRVVGIPARLGFADVQNHLNTPRLREMNGGDLFRWHAFSDLCLVEKWVKATPAFNLELCTRFRVTPLEFNGREDSIFQPFDADQRRHMEYKQMRGVFADVPFAQITATYRKYSPKLLGANLGGDFGADAEQ